MCERPDAAPPPSGAAPVAWRTRDRNVPNQVWTLWNQKWEPTHGELNLRYTYDTSELDAEVQPLYTHPALKKTPENLHSGEAIKANLHSEDAPGGPWEAVVWWICKGCAQSWGGGLADDDFTQCPRCGCSSVDRLKGDKT